MLIWQKVNKNFVVIKDNRFISCLYVNVTTIINIYEKDFYTYCFVGDCCILTDRLHRTVLSCIPIKCPRPIIPIINVIM